MHDVIVFSYPSTKDKPIAVHMNCRPHTSLKPLKMNSSPLYELVFIPCPGAGHLTSTLELANLLIHRYHHLSITILIMKIPFETKVNGSQTPTSTTPRLTLVALPSDDSSASLISPHTFLSAFVEHHKPNVRDAVRRITQSGSVRLAGFVLDMFCTTMTDVANEFGSPAYIYFTSGAASMSLMFHLQAKSDDEGYDVTKLKDSDVELTVASYVNPVPAKVLPGPWFDKEGGSDMFLDIARRIRDAKGIMVNTFQELESHAMESLSNTFAGVPPIFPVGPLLNLTTPTDNQVMTWLDNQPEKSVVFLCFGSMGSFDETQVKEIAVALERSGHRFLWSLRRPLVANGMMRPPEDYEDYNEVLPEGFLKRTSSVGKVIGWAPQVAVLSHPSVGGFVSHCGWNSTLESVWYGVPIAAWPIYAEQQLNAFQMVVELGMAIEIKIDYRNFMGMESEVVSAKVIEDGIARLMSDEEIRKKVKAMQEKSRMAVAEGGSSYTAVSRFIGQVMTNTP